MDTDKSPDSRRIVSRRQSLVLAGLTAATGVPGCLTQSPGAPDAGTSTTDQAETAAIAAVDLTVARPVEVGPSNTATVAVQLTETAGTELSVGLDIRQPQTEEFETVATRRVQLAAGATHEASFSLTPTAVGSLEYRGWATTAAGDRVTTAMTTNTTPADRAWGNGVTLANGLTVTVTNPRFRGGYPPATSNFPENGSRTAPGVQYAIVDVSVTNTTDSPVDSPARESFRLVAGQTIHSPAPIADGAAEAYPSTPTAVAGQQTVAGTVGYRVDSAVPLETVQVVRRATSSESGGSWQARWQTHNTG